MPGNHNNVLFLYHELIKFIAKTKIKKNNQKHCRPKMFRFCFVRFQLAILAPDSKRHRPIERETNQNNHMIIVQQPIILHMIRYFLKLKLIAKICNTVF